MTADHDAWRSWTKAYKGGNSQTLISARHTQTSFFSIVNRHERKNTSSAGVVSLARNEMIRIHVPRVSYKTRYILTDFSTTRRTSCYPTRSDTHSHIDSLPSYLATEQQLTAMNICSTFFSSVSNFRLFLTFLFTRFFFVFYNFSLAAAFRSVP